MHWQEAKTGFLLNLAGGGLAIIGIVLGGGSA